LLYTTYEGDRVKKQFILLYAFMYMVFSVYNTFIPVYFDNLGYTKSFIGILFATGAIVSIITQPLWGIAGDRAKTKNTVLKAAIAGSAILFALHPLSNNYLYLILVMVLFTFFQSPILPLTNAITLEYINENQRIRFGPIRTAGTVGYAMISLLAGIFVEKNLYRIFILYFILSIVILYFTYKIPTVKGHQSRSNKVSFSELFKNRELMILLAFNLVIWTTMQIYSTFFPIYFKQIGANNTLLGAAIFLSAISEVPFLIYADRIIDKAGIKVVLISSALIMGVRWLILSIVENIYIVFLLCTLHGVSAIVFMYCLATYISKEVPKELWASGQMLSGLVESGLARITGTVL